MTATLTTERIHPFEAAGLGLAPFRFVGVESRVGPLKLADGTEVGSPGQPMGVCDFCGQGIANCFHIRSADGKRFVVGCDCVAKVESKGARVLTDVQRALRDLRRERKQAADRVAWDKLMARVDAASAVLAANPAMFSDTPHPQPWRAAKGETKRDEISWFLRNAGVPGRTWACKAVEGAAK